jgi:UDP-glucuronate 4-epimerase
MDEPPSTDPSTGLKVQRILVTGAAGFIGFHLVSRMLEHGAIVHGLDNLNNYYDVALKHARLAKLGSNAHFSMSQLDITNYAALEVLLAKFRPDCVVHLAAQAGVRYSLNHPRVCAAANLDGFLAVLEACRANPVRHLVYASSSSVYGANRKVPFQEDDPVLAPVSLYGVTKRANELMAHAYAHLYGIACSGVRFFTVYGPWGRPDMAYYTFTKAILEDKPIDVFNYGRMQRDFTYIDDVIEALLRLVDLPPGGGVPTGTNVPHTIYNIGNHTPVTLERLISAIEAASGRKAKCRYLPMQSGDVLATWANVDRLVQVTGFCPRTTIEDGIANFVSWFKIYHEAS